MFWPLTCMLWGGNSSVCRDLALGPKKYDTIQLAIVHLCCDKRQIGDLVEY